MTYVMLIKLGALEETLPRGTVYVLIDCGRLGAETTTIVWFGRQKAVCVTQKHKLEISECSQFQKFNFGCLLV